MFASVPQPGLDLLSRVLKNFILRINTYVLEASFSELEASWSRDEMSTRKSSQSISG